MALPIKKLLGPDDFFRTLSRKLIIPEDVKLALADRLMVIGFPLGLYDSVHYLPIAREGTIASLPNVDYEKLPLFLVDGILHPGMSGAPAFTVPTRILTKATGAPLLYNDPISFFVGVHSASLLKNNVPLVLGTIWRAQIIEALVSR